MNMRDAMKALLSGAKIKGETWDDEFIHINEDGLLVDQDGLTMSLDPEYDYSIAEPKITYEDLKLIDKKIDEIQRSIKSLETAFSLLIEKRVNDNFQKLYDQMNKGET